jgi:hypothetical protein
MSSPECEDKAPSLGQHTLLAITLLVLLLLPGPLRLLYITSLTQLLEKTQSRGSQGSWRYQKPMNSPVPPSYASSSILCLGPAIVCVCLRVIEGFLVNVSSWAQESC